MQRRTFLSQTTSLTLAAAVPWIPRIRNFQVDKLRIGVIGCNGMGWSNTRSLLKVDQVELVAICDVDQNVAGKRMGNYAQERNNKVALYNDYRQLLADSQVDAVVIGTPDHWHCKMFCDALEAGKHVYCEKPLSNSIEESYIMRRAASKHPHLMVQIGQWQRSGPHYAEAIDIVRSGDLGNIRLVKTWAYQGWMKPMTKKPDGAPPAGVDYKMWLGPAPERPFNPNRFHFNFRWFWDYAGGLMTDWGVHEIDIALYAMQADAPKSIMASGGKLAYPDDPAETPDTLQTVFEYDNFNMLWEHATGIDGGPYDRTEGIAFIGNNGTLVVNRQGYDVIEEAEGRGADRKHKMNLIEPVKRPEGVNYLDLHTQNFVEAIRTEDASILKTPIVSGSVAAINAHMGNVAYHTGEKIYWDKTKSGFTSKKANKMVTPDYENGWDLPKY